MVRVFSSSMKLIFSEDWVCLSFSTDSLRARISVSTSSDGYIFVRMVSASSSLPYFQEMVNYVRILT